VIAAQPACLIGFSGYETVHRMQAEPQRSGQ
jgi:hypothetical protein